MRTLIHIPTIHSEKERHPIVVDLGEGKYGEFSEEYKTINMYEESLRTAINRGVANLPRDINATRIFSEGLNSGEISGIYAEYNFFSGECYDSRKGLLFDDVMAAPDKEMLERFGIGENKALLLRLMYRGGRLEITEGESHASHLDLLSNIGAFFERNPDIEDAPGLFLKERLLIESRDREIARNINKKLQDGETGILILGTGHDVTLFLDADIRVEPVDPEVSKITAEFKEWLTQLSDDAEGNAGGSPERK